MRAPASILILLLVCGAGPAAGVEHDPGVTVRIDLALFELRGTDPLRPEAALRAPVVTGSPAHPTPQGVFRPRIAIRNPAWKPGPAARERGAERMPPGKRTPMGVAKIPLGSDGFNLHGGADPLLLGKPASLGCLRLADEDMIELLDWLERAGALGPVFHTAEGERRQRFRRPVAFEVR